MLTKFFESPTRIRELQRGPTGPWLESFADELAQVGYAETTARRHIRAAEHFIHWTSRQRLAVDHWVEASGESFVRHLDRCRCPHYGHTHRLDLQNGVRLFLGHLRNVGVIAVPVAEPQTQEPLLLTAFHQWMRQQRGTTDATLYNYKLSIRELLESSGEDPRQFNAQSLRRFVLERSQQWGWAAAKKCTTALRMFLRFLIAEGRCPVGLDASIPQLAHWRLSSLPRYLQPDQVERLLASCDRALPVGKRDRAILLLLARLGLRAGDIVQLRLSDIDWKDAWIQVSGKGKRQTRLPLTQEIGDAIVDYLQHRRAPSDGDRLFTRSRPPFRPLRSHCAVSVIVDRALRRAGVTRPSRGVAHLLRHSAATSMLRQGASLQEIATILRHRSIETTQIYAKVDVETLRLIAQPWPEVGSC
jgi:site-specific recombinase XerD